MSLTTNRGAFAKQTLVVKAPIMNATLSGNHTALSVGPVGGMKMGGGQYAHMYGGEGKMQPTAS